MEISTEELEIAKENQPKEQEEELITDFSQMFKGKALAKRPKLTVRQAQPTPNWLLEIPAKLQITKEQMCQRKQLNQKKWKSITKCSENQQKLLASALSAWNYLFSSKGIGSEKSLTLKQAIKICDQNSIVFQIDNQYERSDVILKCFKALCQATSCTAESQVIIKPSFPNKIQRQEPEFLDYLLKGLSSEDTFYVFVTYNNIICPIGFDKTPLVPLDAFKKLEEIKTENIELWIINGSIQRFQPSFISKRWTDVLKNLTTTWPKFLDLQEPKKGLQRYPSANEENQKEQRGCSHCIIQFKKNA